MPPAVGTAGGMAVGCGFAAALPQAVATRTARVISMPRVRVRGFTLLIVLFRLSTEVAPCPSVGELLTLREVDLGGHAPAHRGLLIGEQDRHFVHDVALLLAVVLRDGEHITFERHA